MYMHDFIYYNIIEQAHITSKLSLSALMFVFIKIKGFKALNPMKLTK